MSSLKKVSAGCQEAELSSSITPRWVLCRNSLQRVAINKHAIEVPGLGTGRKEPGNDLVLGGL